MNKLLSKTSLLLLVLFIIVFMGTQAVFAETLNSAISITAPTLDQNLTGDSVFNVEYNIGTTGLPASLYYSENNGVDWILIGELVNTDNSYAWTVPNISTNQAKLKISLTKISGAFPPVFTTHYNVSEKFKIFKKSILLPILPIEPVFPVFPIDPGLFLVKPNPPADLIAGAISSSKIEIKWVDKSNNELGFRIERMTEGGAFSEIAGVAKNTTSFIDTNLNPETTYFYRLLAYNSIGESAFSNTASTKTDALVPEDEVEEEAAKPIVMKFFIDNSDYYVDDLIKTTDTAPIISESRTVLPIRYVVEPLGGDVNWDASDKRVDISMGGKVINLWIGNNVASINGTMVFIDPNNVNVKPIIIPPGRTMLPLRFIAESLGAGVEWDAPTKQITITYPAP